MSVFTAELPNQPGELARLCEAMAARDGRGHLPRAHRRRVNVDLLLPVRVSDTLFFAVICVSDADKARSALGDQVVPRSGPRAVTEGVPG